MIGASSTLSICISTDVVSVTRGSLATFSSQGLVEHLGHQAAAHVAHDHVHADHVQLLADAFFIAPGHADQSHHGGDADGNPDKGQAGADRSPGQAAEDDGEKCH